MSTVIRSRTYAWQCVKSGTGTGINHKAIFKLVDIISDVEYCETLIISILNSMIDISKKINHL